jgi:hypothetical protein
LFAESTTINQTKEENKSSAVHLKLTFISGDTMECSTYITNSDKAAQGSEMGF